MSVRNYFRQIFTKKKKRSRYAKRQAAPDISAIKYNPTEPRKKETPKASKPDSTIIIIYQDEQKKALCTPDIVMGFRGQPLNVAFKEIKNYDLIKITGFTSLFTMEYGAITLTYRKKNAGLLWVFCQDIDDNRFLLKPRFITGGIDDPFILSPPNLKGYTIKKASGPIKGRFTKDQQIITYYYRKNNYADVSYEIGFIFFKDFYTCFDQVLGHKTRVIIAKETIWRIFETITLTDGSKWCCLGGNIWVKFDEQMMLYYRNRPQETLQLADQTLNAQKLTLPAYIDFIPHRQLILYDQPFGLKKTSILDGTKVNLTAKYVEQGINWFKVDDLGWTISEYLQLI